MPRDSSDRATRENVSNQHKILVRRIQSCLIKMGEVDWTCYFYKNIQQTLSHIKSFIMSNAI